MGTAAVLAATSLAINPKPANAGTRKAERIMRSYGLLPIDECTANVILVHIESEEICALPNHKYGPGTYRLHPDTFELIPFGIGDRQSENTQQPQQPSYPQPTQQPSYPQPTQQPSYPQLTQQPSYPQQPQQPYYPQQPQQPIQETKNSSFHRLSGQPISPPALAMLKSLLAGNNITEAACGATSQQVTITVNNEFVICGHSNNRYTPGNYNFTLNGLY